MERDSLRRAYLPLHSNAASMVVGAPGRAMITRIKMLGLLFDELQLEHGSFEMTLGEQGGIEGPPESETWTTAAERGRRRRNSADLVIMAPDGREKGRVSMSDAQHWRATYQPVLRDMARDYTWVSLVAVTLTEDGKRSAGEQLLTALGPPASSEPMPVRDSVLYTETARDLVAASGLNSVVAMDNVHQRYVRALVEAKLAAPAAGPSALWVACPDVGALSWPDIDAARRRRGMVDLRRLLAALEVEAADAATSEDSFHRQISDRLLARTLDAAHVAGIAAWVGAGRRAAISTIIGATPIGIPVSVGAELAGTWKESGTWLAALSRLRADARLAQGRRSVRRDIG